MWDFIKKLSDERKLSDLHIHADKPLAFREYGDILQEEKVFTSDDIRKFLQDFLSESEFMQFFKPWIMILRLKETV